LPGAEDLVRRYGARIVERAKWTLFHYGESTRIEQVEEVVQEVYCRLLADGGRRLAACRAGSEGQAVSYLGRVVERVVLDQFRKRRAAKRGGGRLTPFTPAVGPPPRPPAHPPRHPAARLLAAERRRLLLDQWREIGREVQGERNLRILRLALIEGWSSEEIARSLGKLRPSSVDSVVHRLRRRFAEEGVALPRRVRNSAPVVRERRRVPPLCQSTQ
jgi:DNA-directed RNA polymerase specialized sigma24 family protein